MVRGLNRLFTMSRVLRIAAILTAVALVWTGPSPISASPGAGTPAQKSVPPETMIGGITPEEEAAQMMALHGRLMKEMPSGVANQPLLVTLTDAEKADIRRLQGSNEGPAVVGRAKPLNQIVRFSPLDTAMLTGTPRHAANGILQGTADGGFVWAMAIDAQGAGAIRVHIGGLDLPAGAELYFFNQSGQAFGPYARKGPADDGDFWTNTVFGSEGIVLLRHRGPNGAADLRGISFVVSEVGHISPKFANALTAATESFCSFNVFCIENASCHNGTPADPAKSAVALMQWISGAYIYTCTGGLLADTVSTSQIPYFLTANHCISQARIAKNMEAYFQFTLPCGSTSCPAQTNPGGMQRLGATIKATGTTGDYTLMQLNSAPPAGSVFLGWNSTPVAFTNNTPLYRISHPAWAPQAYSDQTVDTSAPTCTSWPRGQRIYSRTNTGGTEGGSSGSPVVNGSSQVVGQLSGACGTNTGNSCDYVNNATVDGAFAIYWTAVQPYLDPGGGSCSPAGASCSANSDCCSNVCQGKGNKKTCQ